jgi:SAM-dependent methyltransferase
MNNKFLFLKKIISYFPFLNKFLRKIYYHYSFGVFFVPIKLDVSSNKILKSKVLRLNSSNFNNLKINYDYFLISHNKSIKDYPKKKLEELLLLIKNEKCDVAYDGNDAYYTEIVSKNFLENYIKELPIKNYPYRFFYTKKNFKVSNIGSAHRSHVFNGTFILPSGGKTIGDGGDVKNRLNFIPNLTGKTFLDIGAEEGYSVFNALIKGANFAKGLNINESKEYDFFPDHSRPVEITSRKREDILNTQEFLIKEYSLQNKKNFKFEYENIYNLSKEKFDFVFCFGVLYHLKNPYLALENLYKVTNETLIIETQGIKNEKYLNAKIDEEDGFIRHSSNSLAYLLKMVGFQKVKILIDAYDPSMRVMNIVLKAEK